MKAFSSSRKNGSNKEAGRREKQLEDANYKGTPPNKAAAVHRTHMTTALLLQPLTRSNKEPHDTSRGTKKWPEYKQYNRARALHGTLCHEDAQEGSGNARRNNGSQLTRRLQ